LQVCTTTPCMIRGAYNLVDVCKKKISENESEISKDGKLSWMEVECLGACVNAPMIQINDDYFEDLNEKKLENIIELIKKDQKIEPGSYKGRKSAEPENNRSTLMDSKNA
jgi:NADH:ubiquinone oxidoreductase subunit E